MTLKDYQQNDVKRYEHASVIPLFYECGCGKTLTAAAIAARKYKNGDLDCVLVIAPNGIDEQWAFQELPLYIYEGLLPQSTLVFGGKGIKNSDSVIPYREGNLHFMCVNIDKFSTPASYKKYVDWCCSHKSMIIIDEATVIKNSQAKRTQRLLYSFNDVVKRNRTILKSEPKTVARCILTGTPVTESPFDVWSMFEFLRPSYFGLNEFAFNNKFGMFHAINARGRVVRVLINRDMWYAIRSCTDFEQAQLIFGITLDTYSYIMQQKQYEGPYKHLDVLKRAIQQDASYVRIADVAEMPDKLYIKRTFSMTDYHRKVYHDMARQMIVEVHGEQTTATTKLTQLLRLQQISSGFIVPDFNPVADDYDYDPDPQKIVWIEETPVKLKRLLADIEEMYNDQILVLCQFSAEAELLYRAISKEHDTCLVTGYRTVGSIEGFQNGKYQILVGNIRKLAKGFNLQNAHVTMYYSNSFSYENRVQSEARTWRTGQSNKCRYFDYINKDTVDERVFETMQAKKDVSDYLTTVRFEDMVF